MMRIPDRNTCQQLMQRYEMLPNIVEHSCRVCQVAQFLGRALNARGVVLDPDLLAAAALLHDITKTRSLRSRENHAATGRELLTELGYPEVAEIVYGHVKLSPDQAARPLAEIHVVNYADKRVRHQTVVSLDARFTDLDARYGRSPEALARLAEMKREAVRQEGRIFRVLGIDPALLGRLNTLAPCDLDGIPPELAGSLLGN